MMILRYLTVCAAVMLLFPTAMVGTARADNCGTISDCFSGGQGILLALAAVLIIVGLGFITFGGSAGLAGLLAGVGGRGALALAGGGVTVSAGAISASAAVNAVAGGTAALASGIWLAEAAQGASGSGSRGGSSGSGSGSNRVPDIPQQPPAPKPQPKGDDKLRNIVNNLWHKHDSPTRIGDGTTMSAVRNELRTGRPTGTKYHIGKAKQTAKDLGEWLRKNPGASKHNRNIAENLVRRLNNALHTKRPY